MAAAGDPSAREAAPDYMDRPMSDDDEPLIVKKAKGKKAAAKAKTAAAAPKDADADSDGENFEPKKRRTKELSALSVEAPLMLAIAGIVAHDRCKSAQMIAARPNSSCKLFSIAVHD